MSDAYRYNVWYDVHWEADYAGLSLSNKSTETCYFATHSGERMRIPAGKSYYLSIGTKLQNSLFQLEEIDGPVPPTIWSYDELDL